MENLKVVIQIKDDRALVGVQGGDTDPALEPVQGDLAAILAQVPALLERARARWASTPKNPAYQRPPEPPRPATPAGVGHLKPAAPARPAPTQQSFL